MWEKMGRAQGGRFWGLREGVQGSETGGWLIGADARCFAVGGMGEED